MSVPLSGAGAFARPAAGRDAAVVEDAAGDVWTYSNVTVGYQPAPYPMADVLRARVVHKRQAVRVRMVFDDLRRVNTQWFWCVIRSPGGTESWFVIEARDGGWAGTAYQEIQGEWVHVAGLGHRIDYRSDVVTFRVASRLLAGPGPVRVRLWNELGLPDRSTFYTDNPSTTGPHPRFTAPVSAS
jgi:hypothetical protein